MFLFTTQASVKAAGDMRQLNTQAFKFSDNVFWCTSVQASNELWQAVIASTEDCRREYHARVARGTAAHPDYQWIVQRGDIIEEWLTRYSRGAAASETRGDKKRAGIAFPSALSDELTAQWIYSRSACARPGPQPARTHHLRPWLTSS